MSRRQPRLERLRPPVPCADRADYEKRLEKLQLRMLSIQQAYARDGRRAVIVIEGWDAAGKGGAIKRLTEKLDPRRFQVWLIGPPTEDEDGRHWLYRFWTKLPQRGTLGIFDRSWYGRVLVERVEKLASSAEWRRAYDEINRFERMLTDDGVRIVKIFLHISAAEQLARLAERLNEPHKHWKLSEADLRNFEERRSYIRAAQDMLDRTSTGGAPWTVIHGDRKWIARIVALETIVGTLSKGVDVRPSDLGPGLRRKAEALLRRGRKQLRRIARD